MKFMVNRKGRAARQRVRRVKTNGNKAQDEQDQHYLELLRWMKAKFHFKSKHLKVGQFSDTGRGILSIKTLHPGDPIISMPRDAMIGIRKACNDSFFMKSISFLHQHNLSKSCKISGIQALALLLIEQKRYLQLRSIQGDVINMNNWEPYIKVLPTSFTHLLYWKSPTISLLPSVHREKGVEIVHCVKVELQTINELLALVLRHKVFSQLGVHSSVATALSKPISFNEYKWAWCCINTRCVYSSHDAFQHECLIPTAADNYCLVPFLDLLNHSSEAKVRAEYNTERSSFEIIALEKCLKYKQVFIHYGAHSNAKLLMEYGFLPGDEGNPGDTVPVNWKDVTQLYKFDLPKQHLAESILKQHCVINDWCFTNDGPSWSLLTALLVLECFKGFNGHVSIRFYSRMEMFIEKNRFQQLAKESLMKLCDLKILHTNNGIFKCREHLKSICKEKENKHIELVLSLWKIHKSIMMTSAEIAKNIPLSDFGFPNFG